MPGPAESDVVVVGAGLAGCATALRLAERRHGLAVTLLDSRYAGAGASGRGTGLLGPRFGPPVDVARRRFGDAVARDLFERSERAVRDVVALTARHAPGALSPCDGQLVVGGTPRERAGVHRRARAYRDLGLDVPVVACQDRALPAGADAPALRYRTAAGVDPAGLTRGLAAAAAAHGVAVQEGTTVLGLEPARDARTRVLTARGVLLARAVVVTVDAAAPGLPVAGHGLLDLEVCAQATAVLPADLLAALGGTPAHHVLSASALGAYRRFTPEGRLVVGGGPVTAWRGLRQAALHERRAAAWAWQRRWLERLHPALRDVPCARRWSGRITVTADGLPVLGRTPGPGEVWYAGGWNGHGLAATVLAGERLAESVLRPGSPPPCALWRPTRPWALARPALAPLVRTLLATQVPSAGRPASDPHHHHASHLEASCP